jgi:hypothetical protein
MPLRTTRRLPSWNAPEHDTSCARVCDVCVCVCVCVCAWVGGGWLVGSWSAQRWTC